MIFINEGDYLMNYSFKFFQKNALIRLMGIDKYIDIMNIIKDKKIVKKHLTKGFFNAIIKKTNKCSVGGNYGNSLCFTDFI